MTFPRKKDPTSSIIKGQNNLQMAILTAPRSGPTGLTLENDVKLIRSGILYADRIKLISPSAALFAELEDVSASGEDALIDLVSQLDNDVYRAVGARALTPEQREILPWALDLARMSPSQVRRKWGNKPATPQVLAWAMRFKKVLASSTVKFEEASKKITKGADVSQLKPAIDAGVLDISGSADLKNLLSATATKSGRRKGSLLHEWLLTIRTHLRDPSVHVLCDETIRKIVKDLIDQGMESPGQLAMKNAAEAALGGGLIARLPALPSAPIDELLDLRADLSGPRVRFRAAVSRLEEKFQNQAFDEEFAAEVQSIWTTDVAPALAEIEEEFKDHTLVREVGRHLRQDVQKLVAKGAGIYFGLGALTSLENWLALTASVAGPTAQMISDAVNDKNAGLQQATAQEFFFLFEANRSLTK